MTRSRLRSLVEIHERFEGGGAGAQAVAPVLSRFTRYSGCSAGCSALLGLDMCNSLHLLSSVFFGDVLGDKIGSEVTHDAVVVRTTSHLVSAYFAAQLVREEWLAFSTRGSHDGKDHAGHLAGLAFGVACFAAYRSVSGLVGRRSARARGGRR